MHEVKLYGDKQSGIELDAQWDRLGQYYHTFEITVKARRVPEESVQDFINALGVWKQAIEMHPCGELCVPYETRRE